jgi:cytochrome c biogenesis protein CcmG, thiol:disulfide interchange protein DsbE
MNDTQTLPAPDARGNTRVVFGLALVVTLAVVVLFGLRLMQVNQPALANGAAPTFELKTFDGQTLGLSNLRGKPVVLNFWASWCQPCRDEAPILESAWEQYRSQGIVLIGVDYVDTEPEAKKYLQEFKITYPNGPDIGTLISQAYHITGVPETYFITRDGKLLSGLDANGKPYGNWIGPLTADALQARVEKLLMP